MPQIVIRNKLPSNTEWVQTLIKNHWGSTKIVTRGKITDTDSIPGFIASVDDKPVGLITYRISNDEAEIITLNSENEGNGIGTALIDAVINVAKEQKYIRVWVITTNENISAVEFYRKRGFSLKNIYRNAIEEARKLKPEIPIFGIDGIPIQDELEFEFILI